MVTDMNLTTKRPVGLVPGTPEWLAQIQGPRLILRAIQEIEAQQVGGMSPTGARIMSMLLDRVHPVLTAVHHSADASFSSMTTEELKQKLAELVSPEVARKFDVTEAQEVDFSDGEA
jgi:hypothetical protein